MRLYLGHTGLAASGSCVGHGVAGPGDTALRLVVFGRLGDFEAYDSEISVLRRDIHVQVSI